MMKRNLFKGFALTAVAVAVVGATAATGFFPTIFASANDGKGIYAEKETTTIKDLDREAVITASAANIREGISTAYRVLNIFDNGTKFHIDGVAVKDGEQTNWYRVIVTDKTYGGECAGYIHKSTFQFTDGQDEEKKDDQNDQKKQNEVKCEFKVEKMNKTMKAAQDVYVRKGPKKDFDKMGAYVKGAEVKVTGQVYKHGNKACWVQVNYKGATGYVCTDYLK